MSPSRGGERLAVEGAGPIPLTGKFIAALTA
ncbi:hypothetical protein Sros_5277 [Streptosporangium roseum DSM 43021]|uniref:Uncharacterized protein n=1 Tax=Streptosporangium roseum (strain ATCC 12428 / DSM 43021 / JCM 3005 / KCTC 9067 / NCIMB 10171 / NRRL 2505 / NI 9100) TaxID=479432 RepID=D2BC23_STRRD|nr:hypothetical protein Sros_5277 [Streptosporangium roseum DSM 43021]